MIVTYLYIKGRLIDQWNRIESPEVNSHTYGQLTCKKGGKNTGVGCHCLLRISLMRHINPRVNHLAPCATYTFASIKHMYIFHSEIVR